MTSEMQKLGFATSQQNNGSHVLFAQPAVRAENVFPETYQSF